MAFDVTKLQTATQSAGSPTITLASYSYSANKLGLVIAGWRGASQTAPTSVVHTGMTPTLILKASSSNDVNMVVYRCMAGAGTTSTTVITWPDNTYQVCASAIEIGGVDTSGTHGSGAVGGTGGTNVIAGTGGSGSMTATLPNAFASVDNGTFGAIAYKNNDAGATSTPGSGFTLLDDLVVATYRNYAVTEWQAGNDATVDVTSDQTNTGWAIVGFELVLAGAAGPSALVGDRGVERKIARGMWRGLTMVKDELSGLLRPKNMGLTVVGQGV